MTQLDLTSQAFKRDPHTMLAPAVAAGGFAEVNLPVVGRMTAALGHAACQDLLKDSGQFCVDARNAGHKAQLGMAFLPKPIRLLADNLLTLDDPQHRRLRRLVDTPFRRVSIDALTPQIDAQVARLLDGFAASGETDAVKGICRSLPLIVICDVLGLSKGLRQSLTATIGSFASGGTRMGMVRAMLSLGPVQAEIRSEIADVRKAPRPGLMSALVHAEEAGEWLTDDELLTMVFILFVAGHETTTHLLSAGLVTLLTTPGAWDRMRGMDAEAMLVAVDELMRFCTPVQFTKPKFVREDMEFHGMRLARGQRMMAVLAAGNIDPAAFSDSLQLDLSRKPNRHLGWGGGPHLCLGLHLAKAEARSAFAQMAERWPRLALATDPERLRWIPRIGLRGPVSLPLRLGA